MIESDRIVGGLLLAAGGSSRFGSPKQLAHFRGQTLLRRSAEAICGSGCSPVVVVLGASEKECRKELAGLSISICINKEWETGMASSIRSGLAKLLELEPELDGVLITLMDQPLVTGEHLGQIIRRYQLEAPSIVASEYNDVAGVPALFSNILFSDLENLGGEKGARDLIRKRTGVVTVRLDDGAFDVDVKNDLLRRH